MKEHYLLGEVCRIIVFAVPTMVCYFAICYSPRMTAKLVGTAVSDFLTNILYGIIISMRRNSYDVWFQIVIFILLLILLFIKFHCARVFILQLTETPVTRNFHDAICNSLGNPPVVKILRRPNNNSQPSREISPIYFEYDTWQDLTPFPEVKYSECLKVTTATNCCFTERAKQEMIKKINDVQKRNPDCTVEISTSSPSSSSYFVANTSGKKTNKLNWMRSTFSLFIYYIGVAIGYRLWFEYLYFSTVQEVKVSMSKCIGVGGDNLRAKKNEIDRTAQNNFSLYLRAADKYSTIPKDM